MQKSWLSNTFLVSVPSKKSFSGWVQQFWRAAFLYQSALHLMTTSYHGPKFRLPQQESDRAIFGLVGMNIVLLRKFAKRLLSVNGCKCNLGLETGCVITAWASCYYSSPVDGKVCQLQAKHTLILHVQINRATSQWL
jgi:hypothetical protein